MIPQNLFPARKKAPQKMARPVPVYMDVAPREDFLISQHFIFQRCSAF